MIHVYFRERVTRRHSFAVVRVLPSKGGDTQALPDSRVSLAAVSRARRCAARAKDPNRAGGRD